MSGFVVRRPLAGTPAAYLRDLRTLAAPHTEPAAVLLAVCRHLAPRHGCDPPAAPGLLRLGRGREVAVPAPPAGWAVPELLGWAYEALTTPAARRAKGAHFTSPAIAAGVTALALDGLDGRAPGGLTVCDPAAGGGAFLLAAARWLAARGLDPARTVRRSLFGADIDPLVLAVAESSLWLFSGGTAPAPGHLLASDALAHRLHFPEGPPAGFDAVVGNPPFLSQLARATARGRAEAAALTARFGEPARGYADTSALFAVLGVGLARTGDRKSVV